MPSMNAIFAIIIDKRNILPWYQHRLVPVWIILKKERLHNAKKVFDWRNVAPNEMACFLRITIVEARAAIFLLSSWSAESAMVLLVGKNNNNTANEKDCWPDFGTTQTDSIIRNDKRRSNESIGPCVGGCWGLPRIATAPTTTMVHLDSRNCYLGT